MSSHYGYFHIPKLYLEMGTRKINGKCIKKKSPTRSEELTHSENKANAVGWFIVAATQTGTQNLFIPQCYDDFKGLRIKKTPYCTERSNKLCQFVWPYSSLKVGGLPQ